MRHATCVRCKACPPVATGSRVQLLALHRCASCAHEQLGLYIRIMIPCHENIHMFDWLEDLRNLCGVVGCSIWQFKGNLQLRKLHYHVLCLYLQSSPTLRSSLRTLVSTTKCTSLTTTNIFLPRTVLLDVVKDSELLSATHAAYLCLFPYLAETLSVDCRKQQQAGYQLRCHRLPSLPRPAPKAQVHK